MNAESLFGPHQVRVGLNNHVQSSQNLTPKAVYDNISEQNRMKMK